MRVPLYREEGGIFHLSEEVPASHECFMFKKVEPSTSWQICPYCVHARAISYSNFSEHVAKMHPGQVAGRRQRERQVPLNHSSTDSSAGQPMSLPGMGWEVDHNGVAEPELFGAYSLQEWGFASEVQMPMLAFGDSLSAPSQLSKGPADGDDAVRPKREASDEAELEADPSVEELCSLFKGFMSPIEQQASSSKQHRTEGRPHPNWESDTTRSRTDSDHECIRVRVTSELRHGSCSVVLLRTYDDSPIELHIRPDGSQSIDELAFTVAMQEGNGVFAVNIQRVDLSGAACEKDPTIESMVKCHPKEQLDYVISFRDLALYHRDALVSTNNVRKRPDKHEWCSYRRSVLGDCIEVGELDVKECRVALACGDTTWRFNKMNAEYLVGNLYGAGAQLYLKPPRSHHGGVVTCLSFDRNCSFQPGGSFQPGVFRVDGCVSWARRSQLTVQSASMKLVFSKNISVSSLEAGTGVLMRNLLGD
ncbi:unnamed protein product [Vitrella brassicaformis CCMP3155]|uniref:Uncharacterized protein n=2 Tax=Vitrella brassicaformis TaxID=1169539 RepID=A0A0G4EMU2_VITBC|nr:unnamed protein product [Vitrella brassicaformis CCMP3155]|mmetsp:Transcript_13383/g.38559  ORF Transcript_13383/g.38559 Transcript_13383/m.38559 type:complete len:477 (-) Transcript_13383:220-1650(-)|eukprot:CEL98134.1 unnamed protein product [Vitrella brassicaformis CCMP3155]